MSTNLGKATVKVEILEGLPNVTKDAQKYQFDVNAGVWGNLFKSEHFPPFFAEQISDSVGEDGIETTFSVIFPARRKHYIDNYIRNSEGETNAPDDVPVIYWEPTTSRDGIVYDITDDLDTYTLVQPGNYTNDPNDYVGPEWTDAVLSGIPPPDDQAAIDAFKDTLGSEPPEDTEGATSTTTSTTTTEGAVAEVELHTVHQRRVKDGMWWQIESSDFLSENMPFWVTIRRAQSPASAEVETVFILQLGVGDDENAYDLYLSNQKPPIIVEYVGGRTEGVGTSGSTDTIIKTKSLDNENAKIFENEDYVQIGVMTIGGRLVIFINKNYFIYTKYEGNESSSDAEPGELKEAKIPAGKIRLFGTNIQATVDACPMTFAAYSALALDSVPIMPSENSPNEYSGVNEKFEPVSNRVVAQLPKEDGSSTYFGVDSYSFEDYNGTASPEGFGFHKKGTVVFKKSTQLGVTYFGEGDENTFYMMTMEPDNIQGGSDFDHEIENGGAPYFIRIKGAVEYEGEETEDSPTDVSENVIDVSETNAAEQYYFVKKTANVTLYNKGGTYDDYKFYQKGIRLSWGWVPDDDDHAYEGSGIDDEEALTQTFTGIITSVSTSETPGKETITLNCQDYMHILQNTPIINSPIYDGMFMFYAAKDVAFRAGMTDVVNDWATVEGSTEEEYFLPSGYAFSQPKVHFDSKQMLFECLKYMLERPEAYGYFDEEGILHITKLPGGIFSDFGTPSWNFLRDYTDPDQAILDEKSIDYDYSSTVNKINILSLQMDTRKAIVHTKTATDDEDRLLFRKTMLLDQAALGDTDVVVSYSEDLAQRVFFPIKKTAFKTVGNVSVLKPFDFITVDGEAYRLMSLTRKYNAESNEFVNEYNSEWLGGEG